ncbi:amidase domain-containing protein [Streptomyces sp. NPDC086023]|uniref:amidase domain-containing protein n=1 Tax=Streptomyces sp. NPDC086023 TaxID=3365746 RepID=UPI0037D2628F
MRRTALSIRTASAATVALASLVVSTPTSHAQTTDLPDTTTLVEMADRLLQRRADAVTTAPQDNLATEPAPMTDAAAGDFASDLAVLQDNAKGLEKVNGGYSRAEVTVAPDTASVSGDTATVKVIEDTRLYFPHPAPDAPAYEGYSIPHTLTFTRSAQGEWEIAGDRAEVNRSGVLPSTQITELDDVGPINEPGPDGEMEPDGGPEPEPLEGPVTDAPSSTSQMAAEAMSQEAKTMVTASYNYQYMINYAKKYAYSYNPAYRKYDQDCTNFISQAMRAGGWKMTSGGILHRKDPDEWFYGSYTWSTSYAWAGAHNWYWYAIKHSRRTKALDNVWKMYPSDVLQIDFVDRATGRPNGIIDHTMIVTAKKNGELYLTGHTNNVIDKPLTTILYERRGAWFYAHRT